jgi:PAS domain S-box-containing protein
LCVVVLRLRLGRAVAERRQARDELASTSLTLTRIRQAVESASDAIGIGDFGGNSLYHNPAHVALFGYTVPELNATPGAGVLFADEAAAREIHASVQAGRSWAGEVDILTKDGRRVPASVRADIIRDEDGAPVGIFGVFRDITRERQLAAEAARASKLDSLGMVAGGIVHDFNNLLTVIVGQISLAQTEPGVTDGVRERLAEVEKVAWRSRDLITQLKAFLKGETLVKKVVSLSSVIGEAARFAVQGSEVKLACEIAPDLWLVEADESQLLQVINNLALNAVQAMPEGGRLTVTAENQTGAGERGGGRWIKIAVTDTGTGIAPGNLAKIFDPFFTTKKSGTGLGLATSYSLVAKHGGKLSVESTLGRGSTFCILLPACREMPALAKTG